MITVSAAKIIAHHPSKDDQPVFIIVDLLASNPVFRLGLEFCYTANDLTSWERQSHNHVMFVYSCGFIAFSKATDQGRAGFRSALSKSRMKPRSRVRIESTPGE